MQQILRDFSNRDLFNYAYIPLLGCKKRYIFILWGSWSWKSIFESQREIIKSYQIKDNILCIRKVKDTLKFSAFAELKKRISEWRLDKDFIITHSPMSIKNKLTGCTFLFLWMDNPEKIKSVEWIARVWIEEATELAKEDFDQLDLRLRGKADMQITCTFNPVDVDSFLNVDFCVFWNSENVEILKTTYKDNRFVWEEYSIAMQRLEQTNQNYYKIYALWEWGTLEGLIFDNWETINEIPQEAEYIGSWLDFWFTNDETALASAYKWNNSIIFDEEIYEKGLTNTFKEEEKRNKSIVWRLELIEHRTKRKLKIWADSSEPKSIEEIKSYWYDIEPVVKWPDSIINGITTMLTYKIFITSRSANLLKEKSKYVRKTDKNGKALNEPVDSFNHLIDACRYLSLMKLTSRNNRKKKVRILIPNLINYA
jgi:phage terminase large subunit